MKVKSFILKNWQKSGIKISVIFTMILIIVSSATSFYQKKVVLERNEIRDDMEQVRKISDKYNLTLLWADVGFRGFYMVPQENFLDPFVQAKTAIVRDHESLKQILGKYDFDNSKVDYLTSEMQSYFEVLDGMVEQKKVGDVDGLLSTFLADPGLTLYQNTRPTVSEIIEFSRAIDTASLERYNTVNRNTIIFQLLLLVLGLPVLTLVIFRIRRNDNRRNILFNKLQESNKEFIFDERKSDDQESKDESSIIENMVSNLKKITGFIQNITEGNYSIEWEGMNDDVKEANQTNISGELIKMRDQMIKVKKEDQIRLWVTEGTSKFAEIIRINENNIKELADTIISEMVQYVEANQGGLFLLNEDDEDDKYLELMSCYAYERKKHQEKRIEIGQGLVGQAFLEKEIVFMTEVPDHYVHITSGLGEAPPKSIVIIPMLFKETVVGIIEIASFNEFKEHEVNLLEKLAEIIAAAINNAKTADKTNKLLESSKEYEEMMRSQEEEMRQNMEEMAATQEEMKRKSDKYEDQIKSQDETMASLQMQLVESQNREKALQEQLENLKGGSNKIEFDSTEKQDNKDQEDTADQDSASRKDKESNK